MLLPIELNTINSPHMPNKLNMELIFDKIAREIYLSKGKALQIRQNRYKYRDLLKENRLVWLYVAPQSRLAVAWRGPFYITRQVGNTCYTISAVYQKGHTKPMLAIKAD